MRQPTHSVIARYFLLLIVLVGLFCRPVQASDLIVQFEEGQALGDVLSGKLEKQSFPAPSLGKWATRRVYVYTPPGYSSLGAHNLPVLICLHGTPGDPVEWLYRGGAHKIIDELIKSGKVAPFIAVFPDGHGPFWKSGSEWADAINGKYNMDTAISHDLVAWIRQNYRASSKPEEWAIGGLSEGGYGAANLLSRHSDVFRTGLVLSGEFAVSDDWEDAQAIFGTDVKNREANSPMQSLHHIAPEVRSKLFLYLAVGQDDESDLVAQNERFAHLCQSLQVPVVLDTDRGGHFWGFWSRHLKEGILAWYQHRSGTN